MARWRMKLSCYSFDITYRPSNENVAVDALTRVCSSATCKEELKKMHRELLYT